jgi:hypothetical protein
MISPVKTAHLHVVCYYSLTSGCVAGAGMGFSLHGLAPLRHVADVL